jgi:hypothetical protein
MTDHAHDFDFLFGQSVVRHCRLVERLAGCTEWVEFEGAATARPLLDGLGNVDDNIIDLPDGRYRAVSLRSFDPTTGLWAIWWLDSRNPHQLDVPVIGRFDDRVGTFYANDVHRGEPILVRFTWSDITDTTSHWEQAFSPDEGATWETNWHMHFTKTSTATTNIDTATR